MAQGFRARLASTGYRAWIVDFCFPPTLPFVFLFCTDFPPPAEDPHMLDDYRECPVTSMVLHAGAPSELSQLVACDARVVTYPACDTEHRTVSARPLVCLGVSPCLSSPGGRCGCFVPVGPAATRSIKSPTVRVSQMCSVFLHDGVEWRNKGDSVSTLASLHNYTPLTLASLHGLHSETGSSNPQMKGK